MKIVGTVQAAHAHVRQRQVTCVLVPTMGALHRGHLELMRCARAHAGANGEVAVSIFVNPLQFEPGADLEKYPRAQVADENVCRAAGVDLLFRPSLDQMYFVDQSVFVNETLLSATLCGASRPGHFRGVCTVVSKLFHLLGPDAAIFGEKDYQQLAIIRRLVRDLDFPIEIIGAPTVREDDGLALSSRNQYLNAVERAEATVLSRALVRAREMVVQGETSTRRLIGSAQALIASAKSARIDYVNVVHEETLRALDAVEPGAVMALAVFIGQTRLIDNLRLA